MEFRLIEFIRENRCLYDRTSPLYRCKRTKERKWEEISRELGIDVVTLQKRWRTLRDRFKRQHKRKLESGGRFRIKWIFYKPLSFLKDYDDNDEETKFMDDVPCTTQTFDHKFSGEKSMSPEEHLIEHATNDYEESEPTPPKMKKIQDEDELAKNDIVDKFCELVEKFTETLQSNQSMIRAFFNSMATQVEESNLSFERFAYIQQEVLQVVNGQIKEHRQVQSQNNVNYQHFVS